MVFQNMKKIQGFVFLFTLSLVSAKMSIDSFETDAQHPLPHSKQLSSTQEEYSESQKYVFSSFSKASSSISQTDTQTSKIDEKNTEQIDPFDATSVQEALKMIKEYYTQQTEKKPFPSSVAELASGNETTKNDTKKNNKVDANNTVTEKQTIETEYTIHNNTEYTETNNYEKTTNATKLINANDTTDETKIEQSGSVHKKSEPTNKPEIDDKIIQSVGITGSNASDEIDEVENTTEATTTIKEFQKTDQETVENAEKEETQYDNANAPKTITNGKQKGQNDTGNKKNNELTATQTNSTKAQKVSTKDCQHATYAKGNATKPAKSEDTLTTDHKDDKQNVYAFTNRDTKSTFSKREEEHKKGRYDFQQMDGVKAIHNAIQMDLNFKTLLVEDGSGPGKCFCSCDMNSRPVFIEMDSESINSLS